VALTALPLVLLAPVVTRSLSSLYTARRFLPLVWPLVAVFAAGAAIELLAARASGPLAGLVRRPLHGRVLALAASLLVVWASLVSARPFAGSGGIDFAGGATLASGLSRQGEPEDLLLFTSTLDGSHAGRLAAATWALEGRPVAVLGAARPDPARLEALVTAWRATGHDLFLVTDARFDPPDFGNLQAVELDRLAVVSQAPAPDPSLPPRMAPLPIELVIHGLEAVPVAP